MHRYIRATLVALIMAAVMLVAPTPASAHIGVNPHAPDARYEQFDQLAVNIKPGVSTEWQFRAAFLEQDAWLGPLPDMFQSDGCPSNPATACLTVSQINDPDQTWLIRWDPDGADGTPRTGYIKVNIAQLTSSPGRHWSCASLAYVFGLHFHTGAGGCTQTTADGDAADSDTLHVGELARDALRDAYRRG